MEHKFIDLKTTFFTDKLSAHWVNFVNCPERLKSLQPFLRRVLYATSGKPILDAALGIGCESIALKSLGLEVISNEISKDLVFIANEYARRNGIVLEITNYNWLDFNIHFKENFFANVFLLGNSICLMDNVFEIKKSILNFYKILEPGGKLIIDERNFSYILSEKDEILNGKFRYSYKYVYCGKNITGRPISINSQNIKFGYFDSFNNKIGELDMYPFKKDELKNILQEIGFSKIETYSDFKKDYLDTTDFFTYVATK